MDKTMKTRPSWNEVEDQRRKELNRLYGTSNSFYALKIATWKQVICKSWFKKKSYKFAQPARRWRILSTQQLQIKIAT